MIYYLPFRSVYYWVCYYTFRKKKREHHKSRTRLVLWQFFPFVCFLLLFGCFFFFSNLIPATAKSGCSGTISCFQKLKRLIILMIFLVFSSCRGGRRNFPMTVGFWDIKKKTRIKFSQKKNEAFFFFYFGFLLDPVIDNESNRVKPVGLNEETRPL